MAAMQVLVRVLLFSLSLVVVSFPLLVSAQQGETVPGDEPLSVQEPPPIVRVVTATRVPQPLEDIPASVEVIERDRLLRYGGDTLVDALLHTGSIPLLLQGPTERFPSIRLRGALSEQTLLLVDGLPVTSAQGYSELGEIPLAAVERVEIVRGPASAVWGSEAAGGVINIITRRPEGSPRWELQTRGGTRGLGFQFFHSQWVQDAGGFLLTGENLKDDGVRPNSDLAAGRFTGRWERAIGPHKTLNVNLSYSTSERGSPGPDDEDSRTPHARYSDRQFRWSVGLFGGSRSPLKGAVNDESFDPRMGPSGSASTPASGEPTRRPADGYRWQLYGLHYRQHHQDPDIDPMFGFPESTHRNQTLGMEWARDFSLAWGQAHAGISVRNERTNSTALKDSVRERWVAGLSLEALRDLSHRTSLVAGLRLDAASRHTLEWSPRVGLLYEIHPRHRLRAQVGRVFRLPNFNDLYWDEPFLKGNPNLRPEHGWSVEVGGDHRVGSGWNLSWTLFRRWMKDQFSWRPVDDPSGPWEPYNRIETETSGLELAGRFTLAHPWEIGWTYTYLDARDSESGAKIELIPTHEGSVHVAWNGDRARWSVGVRHRGERPDFGATLPAYTVVMGALRFYLQPHLWLQIEADNLFDVAYQDRSGFPMPGRTIWTRLAYEF